MKKKAVSFLLAFLALISIVLLNKYGTFNFVYKSSVEFGTKHGISSADIINSAIGAFFGMITSLMLEKFLESISKRKSIDNIIAELKSIRNGLNKQIISKLPPTYLQEHLNNSQGNIEIPVSVLKEIHKNIKDLAYVIYVPIWETVLQTGDILEFKEKKYFEDMIRMYTKIYKLKVLIDDYFGKDETDLICVKMIIDECVELNDIFTNNKFYISKLFK